MKVARFVLKIVALSLGAAAAVCAIIAYWDKLAQLGSCAKTKIQRTACASEYDELRGVSPPKTHSALPEDIPRQGASLFCFSWLTRSCPTGRSPPSSERRARR